VGGIQPTKSLPIPEHEAHVFLVNIMCLAAIYEQGKQKFCATL
jgi:hypothetical protein